MHKSSAEVFLCCGIDVSAAQLVVALEGEGGRGLQCSFPNRANGHQALILWLQKNGFQSGFAWKPPAFTVST
jgi:hypothetical protein